MITAHQYVGRWLLDFLLFIDLFIFFRRFMVLGTSKEFLFIENSQFCFKIIIIIIIAYLIANFLN